MVILSVLAAEIPPELLGPSAALVLAITGLVLFYKGKILSRSTVPREDYEAQKEVISSQAEGLRTVTTALNELVTVVRQGQKNGNGVG